jgi:hypothetical protein
MFRPSKTLKFYSVKSETGPLSWNSWKEAPIRLGKSQGFDDLVLLQPTYLVAKTKAFPYPTEEDAKFLMTGLKGSFAALIQAEKKLDALKLDEEKATHCTSVIDRLLKSLENNSKTNLVAHIVNELHAQQPENQILLDSMIQHKINESDWEFGDEQLSHLFIMQLALALPAPILYPKVTSRSQVILEYPSIYDRFPNILNEMNFSKVSVFTKEMWELLFLFDVHTFDTPFLLKHLAFVY